MVNVNLLIAVSLLVFVAIIDCRYPYEDSYRQGDIVPYGNDRYRGNNGGYSRERYPIYGNRDDQYQRDRQDRRSYPRRIPSDQYPNTNRRQRGQFRPRLGGNKKYYDNDYDYGKNRRPQYPRKNMPGFYSYDDSYDYSDQ
ncbi:uncharacterized protein CDAR_405711 [Caerostris darwini]|uniref:Uncharacterized protein n=1 Tax=Caerostris darwini TaxID=1538125 RepID=A0AAV4X5D7_9ARAC|nr:uncharacterized protein CDAR_405711 [Caerostris darwini]